MELGLKDIAMRFLRNSEFEGRLSTGVYFFKEDGQFVCNITSRSDISVRMNLRYIWMHLCETKKVVQ